MQSICVCQFNRYGKKLQLLNTHTISILFWNFFLSSSNIFYSNIQSVSIYGRTLLFRHTKVSHKYKTDFICEKEEKNVFLVQRIIRVYWFFHWSWINFERSKIYCVLLCLFSAIRNSIPWGQQFEIQCQIDFCSMPRLHSIDCFCVR